MRIRDLAGDVQPKSKATVHAGEKLIVGTALQWLEYLEAPSPWVRFPSPAPLWDYLRQSWTTSPSQNRSMLGKMRFENLPEISVFASPLAIVVAGGQCRGVGGSEMLGANRILAA